MFLIRFIVGKIVARLLLGRSLKERARIATIKRRQKKTRVCKNKGCGTVLSLYNDNNICNSCEVSEKQVKDALKIFKDFFSD